MLKIEYKRRIKQDEADRADGYARVLIATLQAEYPGAEVAVTAKPSLCSGETIKVEAVDDPTADTRELTRQITKIARKTWDKGGY